MCYRKLLIVRHCLWFNFLAGYTTDELPKMVNKTPIRTRILAIPFLVLRVLVKRSNLFINLQSVRRRANGGVARRFTKASGDTIL